MSHPLLDDYLQYKNIVDDSSQNDRIDAVLYAVTDFIKNTYGVAVVYESNLNEVVSIKSNQIILKYQPINITALTINGNSWDLSNTYQIGNVLLGLNDPFPNGKQNASITYDIGYDSAANVPNDLKMAVFILTARLYENANNSAESVDYLSNNLGDRIRILKSIPPEFSMLMSSYRVLLV